MLLKYNKYRAFLWSRHPEAKDVNMELKESVKHKANAFLKAVETSQQEAACLALQMPITRMSCEVIFIPTSHPDEWIYLLKDYETLNKMEPESNEIQTHSLLTKYECHVRNLETYSLADFSSLLWIISQHASLCKTLSMIILLMMYLVLMRIQGN